MRFGSSERESGILGECRATQFQGRLKCDSYGTSLSSPFLELDFAEVHGLELAGRQSVSLEVDREAVCQSPGIVRTDSPECASWQATPGASSLFSLHFLFGIAES